MGNADGTPAPPAAPPPSTTPDLISAVDSDAHSDEIPTLLSMFIGGSPPSLPDSGHMPDAQSFDDFLRHFPHAPPDDGDDISPGAAADVDGAQ